MHAVVSTPSPGLGPGRWDRRGKGTATDTWLEEYNKRRPINEIEVIELRTDQKYGKFFVHQPAQA
jgi:hypothetical protein